MTDHSHVRPDYLVNPASVPLVAQPTADQPGTLRQQFAIASLAAENPWRYVRHQDAYQAARRTVLHHARRWRR